MHHWYVPSTKGCASGSSPCSLSLPPKLRDVLVRVAFGQIKETYKGNSQCLQPGCKACAHIKTGTTFCSMTTGEWFQIKATADCWTRNVVYQFAGETENTLHVCLTGNLSNIKHQRIESPVARHFSLHYHSTEDLTIMVIEAIHREDTQYRKRKESRWIKTIQSLTQHCLNLTL